MELLFWLVLGGIFALGMIAGSFVNCAFFRFLMTAPLSKTLFLLK
jgi:hypothetical protein